MVSSLDPTLGMGSVIDLDQPVHQELPSPPAEQHEILNETEACQIQLNAESINASDPSPRSAVIVRFSWIALGVIGVAALVSFVVIFSVDSGARGSKDPFTTGTSSSENHPAFNVAPVPAVMTLPHQWQKTQTRKSRRRS